MTALILFSLLLLLLVVASLRALVHGDRGSATPPSSHFCDPRFGAPSGLGH